MKLAVLALALLLSAFSVPAISAAAAIKAVYSGGVVEISGSGFASSEAYTVRVVNQADHYVQAMAQATADAGGELNVSVTTGKLNALEQFRVYVNSKDGALAAQALSITGSVAPPVTTYKVVYHGNGQTGGSVPVDEKQYKPGDEVVVLGNINQLSKTSYTFAGWTTDATVTGHVYAAGSKLVMEAGDYNLYAKWNAVEQPEQPEQPSSPGSGSWSPSGTTDDKIAETAKDGISTASVSVKGTTDAATGKWTASLSEKIGASLLETAKKAESSGNKAVVEIKAAADSTTSINSMELTLPAGLLGQISKETKADVRIDAGIGQLLLQAQTVKEIAGQAGTNPVTLTITKMDTKLLPAAAQAEIGGGPVLNIELKAGNTAITSFGGEHIKISIPYTKKAGQDPNAIIVYYVDQATGKLQVMRGAYEETGARISFTTSHLSLYAVAYHKVSFQDVKASDWFEKAVTFIAARKITDGTEENLYSPEQSLTRGQFVVLLMRAYQIEPMSGAANNFADAGGAYYTDYLAAAKHLGIAEGVGDNRFAPEQKITRQEMFTLLYNSLKLIEELPEASGSQKLSDFSDEKQIAAWAKEGLSHFVQAGAVSGSNNQLYPEQTASRAEMAQLLYNLLKP
jgi:uncharacterized repeat protein (TIGR02543 family)